MRIADLIFWAAAAGVVYAYLGYPLLLALLAALRPYPARTGMAPRSVSVIIAVHNEEAVIARRTREFLTALAQDHLDGEFIIVSDGSSDRTVQTAQEAIAGAAIAVPCQVIALPSHLGKAAALTAGCRVACHEIIVFADVRQVWAHDALPTLLQAFADPSVGGVSGELILETRPGVIAGVGLYWRYEKALRRLESKVYSMVGATGAISAVRRHLFRPIPTGTILDDVYWPLQVALQKSRVVYVAGALAYDRLPERTRDEFRRKVRTLSGNLQLLTRLPAVLLPWRNGIWFQYVSHKLLRLAVPWLLLLILTLSAMFHSPFYHALLAGQLLIYLLALLGMFHSIGARSRLAGAAASFLVLNAAAWVAFWVWVTGHAGRSWTRASYVLDDANIPRPQASNYDLYSLHPEGQA